MDLQNNDPGPLFRMPFFFFLRTFGITSCNLITLLCITLPQLFLRQIHFDRFICYRKVRFDHVKIMLCLGNSHINASKKFTRGEASYDDFCKKKRKVWKQPFKRLMNTNYNYRVSRSCDMNTLRYSCQGRRSIFRIEGARVFSIKENFKIFGALRVQSRRARSKIENCVCLVVFLMLNLMVL